MMNTAEYSNRPIFLLWSEIEKWTPTSSLLRFGTLPDGWKILPVSAFAKQIEKKKKLLRMLNTKWQGSNGTVKAFFTVKRCLAMSKVPVICIR
jgi:hypothetical protein